MSLRISSHLALAVLLAGCSNASAGPEGTELECAIGPGSGFERVCLLETLSADEFVIHGPDGGFRRFARIASDRFAPADGADEVEVIDSDRTNAHERIFEVGKDRYRIPVSALPVARDE